jgi:hypothetical protein
MKFLLIILTIRFLFALLDRASGKENKEAIQNSLVRHPAEFILR